MGDTSETNTKVLSRELVLGVVALKNAYTEKSLFARQGPFSQVQSHIYKHMYIQESMTLGSCTVNNVKMGH